MYKSNKNNLNQLICRFIAATFLLFAVMTTVRAQDEKTTASLGTPDEVVLQWNRVLTDTVRIPGVHPPTIIVTRSYAMMHLAMFDAVNSIEGGFTPYLTDVPGSRHASSEAAAAQAAHDVLAALYPSQLAVFDTELAASLDGIRGNRLRQGIRVGAVCAERIVANRANDGWNAPLPPYNLPTTPGNWQPTLPGFLPAAFTHFGNVTPFATTGSAQFRPNPPPALTSAEYTADFNEAKELGAATSATRTADQTLVARLWANVGTPTNSTVVWNNVARRIAGERGNSTVENARLFALLYMTHHDALQTSFTSKYFYGLWRPVTAIRRADEDGNPNTAPDAAWTPLLVTPPYPTYAGNAATQGTSEATILALFFGRDDLPFETTWEGTPAVTRSYAGFAALANEQARSRIYGGIHYQFDSSAGQSIGRNVANYVFLNYLKPRGCVFQ